MIPSTWARHSDSAALDDVVAAPRATTSMYAACVTWRMLAVAHARVVATQVELGLDFMEAVHGCDKEISFNANHKCTTCNGSGALADSKPVTCKKCNGKGVQVMSAGFMMMTSPCSACEGAGRIPSKPCGDCKSTGVVRKMKKLKVTIPAGTSECLTELQHSSTHSLVVRLRCRCREWCQHPLATPGQCRHAWRRNGACLFAYAYRNTPRVPSNGLRHPHRYTDPNDGRGARRTNRGTDGRRHHARAGPTRHTARRASSASRQGRTHLA